VVDAPEAPRVIQLDELRDPPPAPTLDRDVLQALREELLEAKFKLDAVLQRID
jgi:hypothetical protein